VYSASAAGRPNGAERPGSAPGERPVGPVRQRSAEESLRQLDAQIRDGKRTGRRRAERDGYGATSYGTSGYGDGGYGSNGYGSNGYGSNGYGSNGYGSNGYGAPGGYGEPGYGAAAYAGGAAAPAGTRSHRATGSTERGLAGWLALLVLVAVAALGGIIDTATGVQVRGGFNIGIIAASVAGILLVRRSEMLPVVLAPPIVYSLGAMFMLYWRSGGLHNKHEVINAALNYLVYGFPAIAAATAAVLIVAGVRLVTHR
jgi:hypothetical protein